MDGVLKTSQALNLRDSLESIGSDIKIKVGLRDKSLSFNKIKDFERLINDVLQESDFNIILVSDFNNPSYMKIYFLI